VDERLTKAERIRQRAEYLHIQGRGRKLHTPNFICFGILRQPEAKADAKADARPENTPDIEVAARPAPSRLGVTVSKRVGGAVVRNRVKRLIREAYRRDKVAFPVGTELVVVARPEAAKVAYAAVVAELAEVGRRIKSGGARSRSA
jgi:ribonuclease P protein component